jgi:hypothetical protein
MKLPQEKGQGQPRPPSDAVNTYPKNLKQIPTVTMIEINKNKILMILSLRILE